MRLKWYLKRGWINDMYDLFVKHTRSSCCLTFKRGDVVNGINNNGKEISIKDAHCKECKGRFKITSSKNIKILTIEMFDVNSSLHSFKTKRRLNKNNIGKIRKLVRHEKPFNVRNAMNAQDDLSFERRDTPSLESLKKQKYKHRAEERFDKDIITSLLKMKASIDFAQCIHDVSISPFHVAYWTAQQQMFFANYKKNNKVILSIDATGSVVKPIDLYSQKGQHIFLYMITAKRPNQRSVPVGQFITSDQHQIKISYILEKWLNDFGSPMEVSSIHIFAMKGRIFKSHIPHILQVIIDDSAALLKACAKSFGHCSSVVEYIKRCFTAMEDKDCWLPTCYLRLDTFHFLRALRNLPIFKSADFRVKKFYMLCFTMIMKTNSVDTAKLALKYVLVVCTNRFESKEHCPVKRAKDALYRLIYTSKKQQEENEETVETDENSASHYELPPDSILSEDLNVNLKIGWIENLRCIETVAGDKSSLEDNWYYLKDFDKVLFRLIYKLPLWSNASAKSFKSKNDFKHLVESITS